MRCVVSRVAFALSVETDWIRCGVRGRVFDDFRAEVGRREGRIESANVFIITKWLSTNDELSSLSFLISGCKLIRIRRPTPDTQVGGVESASVLWSVKSRLRWIPLQCISSCFNKLSGWFLHGTMQPRRQFCGGRGLFKYHLVSKLHVQGRTQRRSGSLNHIVYSNRNLYKFP